MFPSKVISPIKKTPSVKKEDPEENSPGNKENIKAIINKD